MSITATKLAENIIHNQSNKPIINVFIAGIGAVGGTLIQQIRELDNPNFNIEIIGICNSKKVLWNPQNQDFNTDLLLSKNDTDWHEVVHSLIQKNDSTCVLVDATGSEKIARSYLKLLENGIHIATPSKRANTFEQSYFDKLALFSDTAKVHYKFETAVGAGLPVIKTIEQLLHAGDEITEISGVVSGTMTYIFNQLQTGKKFSDIIKTAKEVGYSEPDPRDDLSGEDVARKFLILARTCGIKVEREQVSVTSLMPKELADLSVKEFLAELPNTDDHWRNKNATALVNNKRLRYVGTFSSNGIHVGIKEVASDSPLFSLKGTDNLIQIYTKRYADSPIVIQGPGAGKEVTAAGILSDIIEIGTLAS